MENKLFYFLAFCIASSVAIEIKSSEIVAQASPLPPPENACSSVADGKMFDVNPRGENEPKISENLI